MVFGLTWWQLFLAIAINGGVAFAIARIKGNMNPWLACAAGCVLGLFVWIFLLILTDESSTQHNAGVSQYSGNVPNQGFNNASQNNDLRPCPYCAEMIRKQANFCRFCHQKLEIRKPSPSFKTCPYCAETIPGEAALCSFCGSRQ